MARTLALLYGIAACAVFLLSFLYTPTMSLGLLVFAVATSGYILIALQLEERDLVADFGDRYRQYQGRVGMLLPKSRH